jgi:radical SAM superfamily enzyme YgiQ (UPF0313 family)
MKIGFLAMSGIRAHDPKLLAMGLTLPGFVERSKTIASLPSLGLLYLAAVTPAGHELKYFEAESEYKEPAEIYTCDLVAISTFSAQVFEAYAIADRLRQAGVKVAMGGLHVTVCPEEASRHADYVITGEGENVWPAVVEAAQRDCISREAPTPSPGIPGEGRGEGSADLGISPRDPQNPHPTLSRRTGRGISAAHEFKGSTRYFHSSDYPQVDVTKLPIPRYDLLQHRSYNRFTVQTSRGCPWRCDFCASNVMLRGGYRKRPVEHVVRDIKAILDVRPNAFIEFADDNTFVDKSWGKDLCRQLIPLRIKWFTETDISVADDVELLELMREAGCRQVLIGLESPQQDPLDGVELRSNFKARQASRYAEAVRTIQGHGITVNGCFILGLDRHGPDIFRRVLEFSLVNSLYDVQITILTPFPGTPLYDRLLSEGRILEPGRWDLCTLFDINHQPLGMTVEQLREGMYWLTERLYSAECTAARRGPFMRNRRRTKHQVPAVALKCHSRDAGSATSVAL